MVTDLELVKLSTMIGLALKQRDATLATAESCTGGWIAKVITDVIGSSKWFERGFITYSNEAKIQMINVREETLKQHGAISEPVVMEMAIGALQAAQSDYVISVSGIASSDGLGDLKTIGMVWFACATKDETCITHCKYFNGNRESVRRQATEYALKMLWREFLQKI